MIKTIGEIAARVGCEFHGDPDYEVSRVDTLQDAGADAISFLANAQYKKYLFEAEAGCVVLRADDAEAYTGNAILSDNPYLTYARIASFLFPEKTGQQGIAATAVIDPSASIGERVSIAPNVVIEQNVVVADDCSIGPGVVIQQGSQVGRNTRLLANVTICHDVVIGDHCIVHPGAVIGSDGFGLANSNGVWEKVPQLGSVLLANYVEVGANTTIDRGAIRDTIINEGVKIDNQVMVAHNVEIGDHTAIAAKTGISGSSKIGKHCTLAGASGLVGHITLADYVHITGMTMVTRNVTEAGVYSGNIPHMDNASWRQNVARFRNLRKIDKRISAVEKKVRIMQDSVDT